MLDTLAENAIQPTARALEAKTVGDVAFDPKTFIPIALEEAETEGSA